MEMRVEIRANAVISHFWSLSTGNFTPKEPAKSKKPKIPLSKKLLKSICSITFLAITSILNQPKEPKIQTNSEQTIAAAVIAMVDCTRAEILLVMNPSKIESAARKQI